MYVAILVIGQDTGQGIRNRGMHVIQLWQRVFFRIFFARFA